MLSAASPSLAIPITYPEPDFKIRSRAEGQQIIWDAIRKKELILTPEEWVRQNFVQYLIQVLKYPATLLALEKEIRVAHLKKRCDIVVYRDSRPWMIVECKSENMPLTEKVLEQILRYNLTLKVPYLVLTNGPHTYGVQSDGTTWSYLQALPPWQNTSGSS